MAYLPDSEFCLLTFDQLEVTKRTENMGCLFFWMNNSDNPREDSFNRSAQKRNQLTQRQMERDIQEAKRGRYKPLFRMQQKNEITVLGMKGGHAKWSGHAVDYVMQGKYLEKTRFMIANAINKPGTMQKIDSWNQIFDLAKPKDNRGGSRNEKRNNARGDRRGQGRNNRRGDSKNKSKSEQGENSQKERRPNSENKG